MHCAKDLLRRSRQPPARAFGDVALPAARLALAQASDQGAATFEHTFEHTVPGAGNCRRRCAVTVGALPLGQQGRVDEGAVAKLALIALVVTSAGTRSRAAFDASCSVLEATTRTAYNVYDIK